MLRLFSKLNLKGRSSITIGLVGLAATLFSGVVQAEEALRPCDDIYSTPTSCADLAIAAALAPTDLIREQYLGQVIVRPSLGAPWSLRFAIRDGAGLVEIRSITSAAYSDIKELEEYIYMRCPAFSLSDHPCATLAHVTISEQLASTLLVVWKQALQEVDSTPYPWISDGTTYYVAAPVKYYGTLCGTAVSPENGLPALIARLSQEFRMASEVSGEEREAIISGISRSLQDLSSHD